MFTVLIGALLFGYFLTITGTPQRVTEFLTGLAVGPYGVLVLILLMYLVLGCLMDAMAMIILTVPIVFPVIKALGFDPIWFGVIIVMTVELGLIHPPVGMNVFVIKSVVGELRFSTIFRGVAPFIITDLLRLALLVALPILATWLPQHPSQLRKILMADPTITAGGAILARLKAVGVDYIFANSGTDFPPNQSKAWRRRMPRISRCQTQSSSPHEHAAMGMAHGYYLATGRPAGGDGAYQCGPGQLRDRRHQCGGGAYPDPAVLRPHAHDGIRPLRRPHGADRLGTGDARPSPPWCARRMKWDYELRFPEQALEMVDRAHAIAASTPKGPVYVSLPREGACCEQCPSGSLNAPPTMAPVSSSPAAFAVAQAAALLAGGPSVR